MRRGFLVLFLGLVSGLLPFTAWPDESGNIDSRVSATRWFQLPEGKMAYEDSETGSKTVICVPGMGDARGQFRELAPLLAAQGIRVIVIDPRGQGDSDAAFSRYTASAVGDDLVKFIDSLGLDTYLIGNSSGGASVAWAAAERPRRVKGLILLDAFLRDHPLSLFQRIALNLSLRGPWAVSAWISYYKSLFIENPPKDQGPYTAALARSLRKSHHIDALRTIAFATKSDVESRLKEVTQDTLVAMGTKDPDFDNPEREADWIVSVVKGQKFLVEGAGHYPHLEQAQTVSRRIVDFLNTRPMK